MSDIPSAATAAPLRTADDVQRRVEFLIGRAIVDRRLWLLFVDGDGRQAPVVSRIDDMPCLPDDTVANLGLVLDGVLPEMATDAGPASVVFVRERVGHDTPLRDDRVWAEVLRTLCRARGIAHRGVYLSSPGGVRALE